MGNQNELATYLRQKRTDIEKEAKVFYNKHKSVLGRSYTLFIKYETGERLPSVEYLQQIAPLIKTDLKILCHLWARAQMPHPQMCGYFDGIPGLSVDRKARTRPDEFYNFNRNDIPLFTKHDKLWLVCVLMSSLNDEKTPVTLKEVMSFAALTKPEAEKHMQILEDIGVVTRVAQNKFATPYKEFRINTNDENFIQIRNNNFRNLSDRVLESFSNAKKNATMAQRFTFTFRANKDSVQLLVQKLFDLERYMDTIPINGSSVYSLVVAFSDVFSSRE